MTNLKRGDRVLYKQNGELGIGPKDLIAVVCGLDPVAKTVTLSIHSPTGNHWRENVSEGEGVGQWKALD